MFNYLMPFEGRDRDFDLFKSFFDDKPIRSNLFKTDVKDMGDKYVMEADLPGYEKKDINLSIDGDILIITAKRDTVKEDSKKDKYVMRERSYSSYERKFDITGVDQSKIEAEYKNGVLILDLPKITEQKPVIKNLEIK
ncbi:MAG: Hsp20/alpha crystallin family protein [Ruminococcus sp.]|jgi:HSP20 family protein|nr:Hsp20/alpha crystallin family protein [Ruminococcus sp.]